MIEIVEVSYSRVGKWISGRSYLGWKEGLKSVIEGSKHFAGLHEVTFKMEKGGKIEYIASLFVNDGTVYVELTPELTQGFLDALENDNAP